MDSCRWASYIGAPSTMVDGKLVSLPETEQVSRGQQLMQLLGKADSPSTPRKAGSDKMNVGKIGDVGWNIIVKQTFIEVVVPSSRDGMRRSLSDSALPRFEKSEKPWKCIVSDKFQDMSDASTNVSIEAEDLESSREDICGSSEGEAEAEVIVQPSFWPAEVEPYQPCQYMDSWWMPMAYGANPPTLFENCGGYEQASAGLEQMPMAFDSSTYVSMHMAECHHVNADVEPQEWRTTVMIRNMPNNYTRDLLLELVDSMGFAGKYDFAYLPVDFQSQAGLGYAFVNFVTVADAQLCFDRLEGFSNWKVPSEKVCTVTWSSPTQGFEAHVERYKNSPVMHPSLPDEWKPILVQQGMRVAFPPPSKPIKTPKVRQNPSKMARA